MTKKTHNKSVTLNRSSIVGSVYSVNSHVTILQDIMKLIIVILFGFLWDNINCFGTYNDNAFIPKTFCSTKRRKAVVKMI